MTTNHQALAEQVVASFKAKLEPELQEEIGSARFADLRLLVQDALASSLSDALGQLDGLLRELRPGTEKYEIEL